MLGHPSASRPKSGRRRGVGDEERMAGGEDDGWSEEEMIDLDSEGYP